MAAWVPAHPQWVYTSNQNLTYRQIYVATVDEQVTSHATLLRGFSRTMAPQARPRLFVTVQGPQTEIAMSKWGVVNSGTIFTRGLDSCVMIAVAAYDAANRQFARVAMAHLTGSYYPGGNGAMYTDGNWQVLFGQMPNGHPNGQLYAIVAGSSHRGGWYPDNSVMGGSHAAHHDSNPDNIWTDLVPHNIPRRNFLFYTLQPGICHTMGFAIRLNDGCIGEV